MKRHLASVLLALTTVACSADSDRAGPSAGVILQYHHIATDTPRITSTSPDEFAAHLDFLAEAGFEIWPLQQLVDTVRAGHPTPARVASITFDDAYTSIYTTAFPMLEERGWPFTVFVATEPVETGQAGYLSWDELREMSQAGVTIANHTHSHTHLLRREAGESTGEWRTRIRGELTTAQELIEKNLGSAPPLFAYTYGEYDPDVLAIVRDLGWVGVGQQSGAIGPGLAFEVLPRFPFGGSYNDIKAFRTKAQTLPMPVKAEIITPMIEEDLTPSITLELTDTDVRRDQLVCYTPGGGTAELDWNGNRVTATATSPVPVGRSRYNCTMPAGEGRFYWYSQLWIRKRPDGSWYPEP